MGRQIKFHGQLGAYVQWPLRFSVLIVVFSSVSLSAAAIMLPYLLWVTFAGYLNVSIYLINK